ncbi:EAL domain-containing protein [Paraglaciecola sp. L3A3]|uniref:sensor domain-containing protein n=1 Tax=Paraglaciecola sp. L3A3 TaxID=2686358 RepID=UPI00131EC7B1|nr:EAL domain-containing protein [Paraglaciecola sp. L3A3]
MIEYRAQMPRTDHELRQAIDRLKQHAILHFDAQQLFMEMLREVGELTDSSFAIVLKQVDMDNNQPRHTCIAAQHRSNKGDWGNLDVNGLLHLDQSAKPFFDVLLQCKAMVLDRLGLRILNNFNSNWPSVERAMLIPMGVDKYNNYLICIGNSKKHYHTEEVQRLWPLLIHVSTQLQLLVSHSASKYSQKEQLLNKYSPQDNEVWRNIFYRLEKTSPLAMITLNSDKLICRVNESAENLLSIAGSELLQKPIEEFLVNHSIILQALKNTSAVNMASRMRSGLGSVLDVKLNLVPYEENNTKYDLVLIEKVESLTINQNAVAVALERFQVLASMLPMGILQTDAEWQTEYFNQRWLEITDCKVGDVYGLGWMQLFHPDEAEELLTQLHISISGGHEFIRECQMVYQQSYKWVMLHVTPIIDPKGEVKGLIATVGDFSKQHEAEERLREMAEKDPLTGLSNRACFFDRLDHALDRVERHGSLALLALDLDGFKHINDTLGHDVGDFILIEVAKRLRNCVRIEDTVCRVGGDEFLLIIEGLDDATIVASLAEKVLHELEEPYQLGSKEIFISTSIGISFSVTGRKCTSKTLLKQADLALYRAKDAGRNNYQYYSPELEQASRKKLELTNDLHRALGKQEFEVFYQAQIDIDSNKIKGFEALLRWQHPQKGMLSPTDFIPLLEESGLISNVSDWMCQHSFHQLRQWIDDGLLDHDAVMAVNISPRQFYDEHLVEQIYNAIVNANLSCANVVVEVTETLLLKEHSLIIKHLQNLHALGIKIALDDFGTGFSSLSYLKKFPIDIIKIDRSFIKDIATDESDSLITRAVIKLGESLGLTVLAEGVDSAPILALLKQWHCEKYQGYLVNQPVPANQIKALCAEHKEAFNNLKS